MTIRYERHRESARNLTGGPYVHFPAGVVEIDLDDPERERRIADHYDAVELVEAEADSEPEPDLCGAIKTNGEPCDRLADECRWHSPDEDDAEEDDEDGVLDDVEIDVASDHVAADVEVEQCGAEMTDGSVCHRPADTCHFHADDDEDGSED